MFYPQSTITVISGQRDKMKKTEFEITCGIVRKSAKGQNEEDVCHLFFVRRHC